jgi:hypothetical protein
MLEFTLNVTQLPATVPEPSLMIIINDHIRTWGTVLIGIVGIIIATMQFRINREKQRYENYDRNFAIYKAAIDVCNKLNTLTEDEDIRIAIDELATQILSARFIHDDTLLSELEALHKKAEQFLEYNELMLPMPHEEDDDEEERLRHKEFRLEMRHANAETSLGKGMDIDRMTQLFWPLLQRDGSRKYTPMHNNRGVEMYKKAIADLKAARERGEEP